MFLQMMPINRSMTRETLVAQKQAAEDEARKSGGIDLGEVVQTLTHRMEEFRMSQSSLTRAVADLQAASLNQTSELQRSNMQQLQLLHHQVGVQLQQVVTAITTSINNSANNNNNNNNNNNTTATGHGTASRRASSLNPLPPHV